MVKKRRWRQLRASLRDTWLLFRQFRWPLLAFIAVEVGGGASYWLLAEAAGESVGNLPAAIFHVLSLTFFQPNVEFPQAWYLEIYYFVMPVIGVIILAQGVTEFGVMLFNRQARAREWEVAVAATFNRHHILVGLGHLGYRVANSLHEIGQDVVVVELNPSADLVANVKSLGIPVIQQDAAREATLESAGVKRAHSIILCTQNDSLNLQVALKARHLNPNLRVVVRIFDDDFAQALQDQFGFIAFSATNMAAPAFAAAAADVEMTRPITIEGQTMSLARLRVNPASILPGMTIGEVEKRFNVSVVLLRRNHESDFHPAAESELMSADTLAVLGCPAEIGALVQQNNPAAI